MVQLTIKNILQILENEYQQLSQSHQSTVTQLTERYQQIENTINNEDTSWDTFCDLTEESEEIGRELLTIVRNNFTNEQCQIYESRELTLYECLEILETAKHLLSPELRREIQLHEQILTSCRQIVRYGSTLTRKLEAAERIDETTRELRNIVELIQQGVNL
jgi:hypothetical protein